MPVENSKPEAEKRSGQGAGRKITNGTAELGKKRKKKRKEKCAEPSTRGATSVQQGARKPPAPNPKAASAVLRSGRRDAGSGGLVLIGSAAHLKKAERSSSNSSIEYSKPVLKAGRFDCSSSDAMSIGGCTSANSSGAMDVKTSSPQTTSLAVTRSANDVRVTLAKSTSREDDCAPVSEGSGCDHASAGSRDTTVCVESLRWDYQCSDEEEEKKRIEVYKENRRQRYEKALEQRKAQLSVPTTNKYYI